MSRPRTALRSTPAAPALFLLLALLPGGEGSELFAQEPLIADGMITPKDATTEAEIVVMQLRTAEETPGPPVVVGLEPPRLVLSAQGRPADGSLAQPFPQRVGRLAAGSWRLESYSVDWSDGGAPRFDGFATPVIFHVTRGEVHPRPLQPTTAGGFSLVVEGPWRNTCLPEVDSASVEAQTRTLRVDLRRTDSTCVPPDDRPGSLSLEASVGALDAGRWEVEVRVPGLGDPQRLEVYATASLRVVTADEPRIVELRLEADPDRYAHDLVVVVEIPTRGAGASCASWQLRPRQAWAHGRDLHARFELAPSAAPCGDPVVATHRFPVADLDSGLYRLLAERQQGSAGPELWAQSPTLVAAQRLGQLIDGRFQVTVTWRDHEGRTGRGVPAIAGDDSSAVFSFFRPDNWELLVKVLDGCALNGHFWVFGSASTDVEYTLRVEDRVSGEEAVYRSQLGRPSPAITDTRALAGCE